MIRTEIRKIVRAALREDIGAGDITTSLCVDRASRSEAVIRVKEKAVVCGLAFACEVFRSLDKKIRFASDLRDGDMVARGAAVAYLGGSTRAILTGERVALNFLSYLSAIATRTRKFSDAVKPRRVDVLDTRKTTPTLRTLERYAVRCGGGGNHRFNLNDMVLVKDNHRVLMGSGTLAEAVTLLRKKTSKKIEVEVDMLAELKDVLAAPVDMVLLDNMTPKMLAEAVRLTRKMCGGKRPLLEASGGIGLHNVKAVVATGVDRISIGGLTHSRQAIDYSLEWKG